MILGAAFLGCQFESAPTVSGGRNMNRLHRCLLDCNTLIQASQMFAQRCLCTLVDFILNPTRFKTNLASRRTMEPLTSDEVRHVARLANLSLSEDEIDKYRHQLTGILGHVQSLQQIDTDGVEPTGHATDSTTVLRDDDPSTPLDREDVLKNAPVTSGEFIRVRSVLD